MQSVICGIGCGHALPSALRDEREKNRYEKKKKKKRFSTWRCSNTRRQALELESERE
jgi:hypothetical protein